MRNFRFLLPTNGNHRFRLSLKGEIQIFHPPFIILDKMVPSVRIARRTGSKGRRPAVFSDSRRTYDAGTS